MMYDCDGVTFDDLKNPYTGEKIAVKMLVCPNGATLFAAPGTYSPGTVPADSSAAAYRLWNRVDGKEGLRAPNNDPVTCAWTGKALTPVHTDRGWIFSGGFDPTVFLPRDQFLWYINMRNGVSTYPKPGEFARVEQPAPKAKITRRHRRGVEERSVKLDEDSVRAAERIMKSAGVTDSPTVSMHVPSGASPED